MRSLRKFDPAKYLTNAEAAVGYLEEAARENDPAAFDAALRDVDRSRRTRPANEAARAVAAHA